MAIRILFLQFYRYMKSFFVSIFNFILGENNYLGFLTILIYIVAYYFYIFISTTPIWINPPSFLFPLMWIIIPGGLRLFLMHRYSNTEDSLINGVKVLTLNILHLSFVIIIILKFFVKDLPKSEILLNEFQTSTYLFLCILLGYWVFFLVKKS